MGEARRRKLSVVPAGQPPEFVPLPVELLTPMREGQRRYDAIKAEADDITQRTSNIATAYLLGLGVDTNKHTYTIDLPSGALVLQKPAAVPADAAGKTAEPAAAAQ